MMHRFAYYMYRYTVYCLLSSDKFELENVKLELVIVRFTLDNKLELMAIRGLDFPIKNVWLLIDNAKYELVSVRFELDSREISNKQWTFSGFRTFDSILSFFLQIFLSWRAVRGTVSVRSGDLAWNENFHEIPFYGNFFLKRIFFPPWNKRFRNALKGSDWK